MASIVRRLTSRSITGRDLGIDVHKPNPEMLHFLWRKRDTERCYTHYFERRLLETEEYTLFQDHIFRAGFSGICECLSIWLPPPKDKHFRTCHFKSSDHIIFHSYRPSSLDTRCKCPDLYMLGEKRDVTTTIFCLSQKNSIITSKVPHTDRDWLRSRYFVTSYSYIQPLIFSFKKTTINMSELAPHNRNLEDFLRPEVTISK
jgi:hypothetical protein